MKTFISSISKKEFQDTEKVIGKSIRKSIYTLIKKEYPDFNAKSLLSISELNQFRQKYMANYLINEVGELSNLEEDVLKTYKTKKRFQQK